MKWRNPRLRTWAQRLGLSLILFALVIGLSAVPVVRESEVRLTDTFFRLAPPPKKPSAVVLVLIDDESLQQYGRWPWSRVLLTRLLANLSQTGAEVIGLDILLSEPQAPDADAALQGTLGASGRVVIVGKIGAFSDGPHWVPPLPQFAQTAVAVGHAHAVLDADSVCRRFPPRELTTDGSRWAFAIEVARRIDPQRTSRFLNLYNIPVTDEASSVTSAQPTLVRIPFRRDGFQVISANTVLQGGDLGTLRGRPVLVGFGATEISDRLNTPLATELPTPGIEVHAQILDGILTGRMLHDLPVSIAAMILPLTCLVAVVVFSKWRGWTSVGLILVIGIAVYMIAFLAFLWASVVVPAGAMLLAVMMGPLLVQTADFALVERSVTQQLLGLRSWLTVQGKETSTSEKSELSWKLELLQRLQTELGSLYELHKTLLESAQDPVAIFDDRGNLLLNNQAFSIISHSETNPRFTLEQLRAQWLLKDDLSLTATGLGEEGEVYFNGTLYSARIMPLPPTTLSPGGGTIVTLTNLQTRVERDRARAEALGFITHELRTPLASIQGFADLMMRYPGSADCEGAPETIFWESKRLLALINSYLDVLRLDAGAKPVRTDMVDLDDMVSQVFDILRPLAAAANMRLVSETEGPVMTLGDAPLISGAVLNLVSNAIKYGKPGTEVRVRCSGRADGVGISVHNLGEPIIMEEIPRLFDSYYRAPNVESSKPGWGLGLAFVKRIAEKHGGSVHAESTTAGTTFEIRLPAKIEVDASPREMA